MEQQPRRIKLIRIAPEFLCQLFSSQDWMTFEGLPEGTTFMGWFYDKDRNCHTMFVEHESFDVVPLSDLIPELQLQVVVHKTEVLN